MRATSRSRHQQKQIPRVIEDRSSYRTHVKRYERIKHLGQGGFAHVYEVVSQDSGRKYACKIVTKHTLRKPEHKRKLWNEIRLHRSLNHPNIVAYERYFEDKENVYILLECCPHRSLMQMLHKRKVLTEDEVRFFMKEIIVGVSYLHERNVIHRDLKLGNVLLDQGLHVKLCDFGLATQLAHSDERKTTICGTPNYIAPEILDGRQTGHSFEVDVWSIGVILFTMITGKPPFETQNVESTYEKIRKLSYHFPSHSRVSAQAKDLISSILVIQAKKRPTVQSLQMHPFFTLPTPASLPPSCLTRPPTKQELYPTPSPAVVMSPPMAGIPQGKEALLEFSDSNKENVKQSPLESAHPLESIEKALEGVCGAPKVSPGTVHVTKHVDYAKKYGIGYVLSNGCTGVYFNDSSKIVLHSNGKVTYIASSQGNGDGMEHYTLEEYPAQLTKKMTLLSHFDSYLSRRGGKENSVSNDVSQVIYVKKWIKTKHAILFRLSNKTVQINFMDNTQLVFSSADRLVTYTDKNECESTFPLDEVLCTDRKDLKKRMKYTQDVLRRLLRPNS